MSGIESDGTGTRATAYWVEQPGRGTLRTEPLPDVTDGQVRVRALHSGISRGTELLVLAGRVPDRVRELMRAPFQAGEFPGPVKYGYLSVGVVEQGPVGLQDERVFCLHPHQDRYVVPAAAVHRVPDAVPSRRAVLAGTMETAVNAVWDTAPQLGDRVAVVGAGMVGATVASLLARFPLNRLELVDVDPVRGATAGALDVDFRVPADASDGCDIVVHCSATGAGLDLALSLLADDGRVVELSWYGDQTVPVHLGGDFHARRLSIRSSQVGAVAVGLRHRRSAGERMALALDLLADDRYDQLLGGPCDFRNLPRVMAEMASGAHTGRCVVVDYPTEPG